MKINGPGRVGPAALRGVRRTTSNGGKVFQTHLGGGEDGEDAKVARVGGPPPVAPVDAILSIQEVPDATERRRRLIARGAGILDRLDEIQLGLLAGGIPRRVLEALTREVSQERGSTDDPRLLATLDEIDLRARVELAKYDATR